MTIAPNRAVAIATPLVFAPVAGAVTALAAKYAPGVEIDEGQLQAIFIAGATIAVAKAGLWMKGWQDYEKQQEIMPADALEPANAIVATGGEHDMDEDPEVDAEADAEAESTPEDAEFDDDVAEDEPDDLMAEIEAALAEDSDPVSAGKV